MYVSRNMLVYSAENLHAALWFAACTASHSAYNYACGLHTLKFAACSSLTTNLQSTIVMNQSLFTGVVQLGF